MSAPMSRDCNGNNSDDNVVCSIKLLLIHALQNGHLHTNMIEEVLTNAHSNKGVII